MADEFVQNPSDFYFYELEEYLELVIRFVERLRPEIAIERIASEVPPRFLLMPPKWDMRYDVVLRRFEEKLEEFDTFQGKFYV